MQSISDYKRKTPVYLKPTINYFLLDQIAIKIVLFIQQTHIPSTASKIQQVKQIVQLDHYTPFIPVGY